MLTNPITFFQNDYGKRLVTNLHLTIKIRALSATMLRPRTQPAQHDEERRTQVEVQRLRRVSAAHVLQLLHPCRVHLRRCRQRDHAFQSGNYLFFWSILNFSMVGYPSMGRAEGSYRLVLTKVNC